MKKYVKYIIASFFLMATATEMQAQYGYGGGGYGYGNGYGNSYGRQRSSIPQAQSTPKEPEPLTAEQIVDNEMPTITETLELNAFETAVMSTILKKYIQKRIELQILKLTPDKMREAYEKITADQTEELKAGLPLEKYEAFVDMQKKGIAKASKEKKREKKKKRKNKS